MKFLVTGAAGFIGSHLTLLLAKSGNKVLAVDNINSYYSPELKKLRVSDLLAPEGISLRIEELSNLDSVQKLVRKFQPDAIIHLAAQPGVRTPIGNSHEYIQNNLVAFSNILQIAVEENIPEILYASSSSVYGNSSHLPYREDDLSIRPVSIYGATKLANEILASAYVSGSNSRARGMRFFTVYGPWGRPDMAYFRIIDSILNGTEFKKFGGGERKRDFTYVDDICNAVQGLARELLTRPTGYTDIVNIGGGNPYSLNDLIIMIGNELNSLPTLTEIESNPNDTLYTSADVTLLSDLTDTVPFVDLKTGIKMTVAWAKKPNIRPLLSSWINSTY